MRPSPAAATAILLCAAVAAASTGAAAPAARPLDAAAIQEMVARLRAEEQTSQGAYGKLAWLCDRIGPRLSGSPQAAAAVGWAAETMRRDGLTDHRHAASRS